MPQSRPSIFLTFANDRRVEGRCLRNLPAEQRAIRNTLTRSIEDGRCTLIERAHATREEVFDVLLGEVAGDRIAVFHFGGHAGDATIMFEGADGEPSPAHAHGLAAILGRQQALQLVFLNGCATHSQATDLMGAGVPSVIVTHGAIADVVAAEFAGRFYQGLAAGRTVKRAFNDATATVMARLGNDRRAAYHRSFAPPQRKALAWPWGLLAGRGGDWRLSDPERPPGLGPTLQDPSSEALVTNSDFSNKALGMDVAEWHRARNEVASCLERGVSVNLVVDSRVAWRPLIESIRDSIVRSLAIVSLERGTTASRRGLIEEVLKAWAVRMEVPEEPNDLAALDRACTSGPVRHLALTHLDLSRDRRSYGLDFFAALRHLIMGERARLVLLAVSRSGLEDLLPIDHPLSHIELQTVVLRRDV